MREHSILHFLTLIRYFNQIRDPLILIYQVLLPSISAKLNRMNNQNINNNNNNNTGNRLLNQAYDIRQVIDARRTAAQVDLATAEYDMADADRRRVNARRELRMVAALESNLMQETEARIRHHGDRVAQLRAIQTFFGSPQQQAGNSSVNPIDVDTPDVNFMGRGTTWMFESSGVLAGHSGADRKHAPMVVGDPPRHFVDSLAVAAAGATSGRNQSKRPRNVSVDPSRNATSRPPFQCSKCKSIGTSLAGIRHHEENCKGKCTRCSERNLPCQKTSGRCQPCIDVDNQVCSAFGYLVVSQVTVQLSAPLPSLFPISTPLTIPPLF